MMRVAQQSRCKSADNCWPATLVITSTADAANPKAIILKRIFNLLRR